MSRQRKHNDLVTFSLLIKEGGKLTKSFAIDEDGELVKDSGQCFLSKGFVETIEMEVEDLPGFISSIDQNQALVHGVCDESPAKVVTEAQFTNQPNTVTRTKKYFKFPALTAGLMLFDVDGPVEIDGKRLNLEQIIVKICEVIPGLEDCYMIALPSTSSGVHRIGEVPPPASSWHIHVVVENQTDIPRFAKALNIKLWLAGYGWIKISRVGSLLERNALLDMAVFSPERLVFEAKPDLCDGLERTCLEPVLIGNKPYDTSLLSDPDESEIRLYEKLVNTAKQESQPEANRVKALYNNQRITALMNEGYSRQEAKRIADTHSRQILTSTDKIILDGGEEVAVCSILDDPESYDLETCHDPIDPDEGPGKGKFLTTVKPE